MFYKIVNSELRSLLGHKMPADYAVQYQIGKWVLPKSGTRLFIWPSLETARRQSILELDVNPAVKLFECLATGFAPLGSRLSTFDLSAHNLELFWAGKLGDYTLVSGEWTVCDAVKLVREIV